MPSLSLSFTNTKAKRVQGVVFNSVFVVVVFAFASAFALFLRLIVAIK